MTGGIPSTAAMSAATQAGDYYATKLSDKIPELQQLAYQMYMNEGSEMRSQIGLLQGLSDSDYGRHRDSVGDWQYDRNFDYQKYMDDWNKSTYENERDYTREQDSIDRGWAEQDRAQKEHDARLDEAYRYYQMTGDPSWYYELVERTPSWSSYGGGSYSGGGGSYSGGSSGGSSTGSSGSTSSSGGSGITSPSQLSANALNLASSLSQASGASASRGDSIDRAFENDKISYDELRYLKQAFGVKGA